MCGIVGCSLSRPLTQDDLTLMRTMRDRLEHRGPDDGGEFYETAQGLYLGHRRLSIIDLDPRSAQPMEHQGNVLAYNGEIYNYRSIQKELAKGKPLETAGDTEVVLRSWQMWGREALNKFDGMFAFGLWDREKTLHLVTDFFGEKPLYTYTNEDGIYFASEAGALIETFNLEFTPTDEEQSDLIYLGYIRPPHTGFKGLRNIAPAQHLIIKNGRCIKQETHWTPPPPNIGKGRIKRITEADINNVRDILCESLESRLYADVPIGLFLSGGVDSSLIAALTAKELNMDIETYTVAFPDGLDESKIAQNIATHFNLPHTIISSTENELWKQAPAQIANLYGTPNDNMTAIAVYQMCEKAKQHLTVAISGLGGDEIFYGYNKYEFSFQYRYLYRNSKALHVISEFGKPLSSKIKLMNDLMQGTADRQYLRIKNTDTQNTLEKLVSTIPKDLLSQTPDDLVHRINSYDLHTSMPQSFIPAIDRGSMRASLEVRTPFLSRRLLSYVHDLDQRSLIAFGKKNILRTLLTRYMDSSLLCQDKRGFVFPASRYYKECNPPRPNVKNISADKIDKIWQQKEQPAFQRLVTRLSLLDHFYRHGCSLM